MPCRSVVPGGDHGGAAGARAHLGQHIAIVQGLQKRDDIADLGLGQRRAGVGVLAERRFLVQVGLVPLRQIVEAATAPVDALRIGVAQIGRASCRERV